MKKLLEKSKDILYDSIDYIIILGIIGIVVLIIGWRLDLLFENDSVDMANRHKVSIIEDQSFPMIDNNEKEQLKDSDYKINIPPGSSTYDISTILKSNDLISNPVDFINLTEKMKLSNKLKAGNYEIPNDSSIENIIEILTK